MIISFNPRKGVGEHEVYYLMLLLVMMNHCLYLMDIIKEVYSHRMDLIVCNLYDCQSSFWIY